MAYPTYSPRRPGVRWGWISAVALGWLLGLNAAAWLGVTGARLGPPDAFDLGEVSSTLQEGTLRPIAASPRFPARSAVPAAENTELDTNDRNPSPQQPRPTTP